MRYGLSIVVLLCAVLPTVSVFTQRQADPVITTNPTLERLTVPPELLPDGCQLGPRGGLPFRPMDSNPVITEDPQAIRLLAGFVLGIYNAELEAKLEAVTDRAERRRILEEWSREQAAEIEAAYLAMYRGQDGKEIGVWALLFKEPIDRQEMKPLDPGQHIMMKESMVIVAWADSEDRACYEAVRRFLEQIE